MKEKGILEKTGRGCYGLAAAHLGYNKHNKERKSSPDQASKLLRPSLAGRNKVIDEGVKSQDREVCYAPPKGGHNKQ